MPQALAVASSVVASSLRGWRGTAAFRPRTRQPEQPLQLYEFEACPYCRLVREALTELDLDAVIHPCPRGGTRFRPEVKARGGKLQFPFLFDPNTGRGIYESADIIDYLSQTYGGRLRAARGAARRLALGSATLASLARRDLKHLPGLRARPSKAPQQPLELYSFESSPYSRLVREVLCELELPYLLRNTAKARWEDMGPPSMRRTFFAETPVEGRNRQRLLELAGRVQVPYLVDPNTSTALFESADIIRYLEAEYAA
ncbi:MAG: glutathione S-transferase N-terminal domain-containing protein [Nevskia sp.]|nr:glutathione S-transferase N-terminal domain-containing protein [Nevskia sp.]